MTTCPECGATVDDNVCSSCGTSVWPQGTSDDASDVPPPAVDGDEDAQDASTSSPGFVNPPETESASPPPSDRPSPPAATPPAAATPPPSDVPSPSSDAPPPPSDAPPPPPGAPAPPPGGADAGWQPTPATVGPDDGSSGSSKRTLWWVLGGLAVLAVLGVLAVLLVLRGTGLSPDEVGRVGEGSPERLAELRAGCEAGDMQACDDLYLESPFDSEDEAFGDSCGGRNEPAGWCVDVHGETAPPN